MSDIGKLAEELKRAEQNLKAALREDGGLFSHSQWWVNDCKVKLFDALTDGIPLDRLEEICNAERDGRCVVLQCKVGDTVWVIASCEDVAKSCDDDYFNGTGEITCPYGNTCEFEECADDNIRVFETSINCVVIEEDGKFTFWVDTLLISFGVSKIGKTVFLTRAEAEAALQEVDRERD